MSNKKKQHIIPQFYLRYFANPPMNGQQANSINKNILKASDYIESCKISNTARKNFIMIKK